VYIKLVVLLRNYVTMMHGQQNIKNGWATIVVVGRLRVNELKAAITALKRNSSQADLQKVFADKIKRV
jgi:hypothetical protein